MKQFERIKNGYQLLVSDEEHSEETEIRMGSRKATVFYVGARAVRYEFPSDAIFADNLLIYPNALDLNKPTKSTELFKDKNIVIIEHIQGNKKQYLVSMYFSLRRKGDFDE